MDLKAHYYVRSNVQLVPHVTFIRHTVALEVKRLARVTAHVANVPGRDTGSLHIGFYHRDYHPRALTQRVQYDLPSRQTPRVRRASVHNVNVKRFLASYWIHDVRVQYYGKQAQRSRYGLGVLVILERPNVIIRSVSLTPSHKEFRAGVYVSAHHKVGQFIRRNPCVQTCVQDTFLIQPQGYFQLFALVFDVSGPVILASVDGVTFQASDAQIALLLTNVTRFRE